MSSDVTPGRYRHFKGGEYEVILVARDVETEEPAVVYQAVYSECGHRGCPVSDSAAPVSRAAHQ